MSQPIAPDTIFSVVVSMTLTQFISGCAPQCCGVLTSCWLFITAVKYTGAHSNYLFALRNSIAGIRFPSATSDLRDLIKAEKLPGLRM